MEKQRIKMLKIYLLLMGILLLLTGCKETEAEVEDTLAATAPKDSSDNQTDNLYTLLNQDLLGKAFLQPTERIIMFLRHGREGVTAPFWCV